MPEEPTFTCEDCGHVYTVRYGRLYEVVGGARMLCHPCIDKRKDAAK